MEQKIRQLVRIANVDLDGNKSVSNALRKMKGVSFMISNAVCNISKVDKYKKVGLLDDTEIKQLETVLLQYKGVPTWMLNRRKDYDTGEDKHIIGAQVMFVKTFDVKRMQESKSNRGLRHAWGLPVRGQRTRSHFRKNKKKGSGIKKKVVKREAPQQYTGKGKK